MTEILLGALLFVLVAAFVLVPLRRERLEGGEDPRIADLESRKEAKYREIRDTELDHAAGKLSDEDFRRQDAELRREAVEILNQLDEAKGDDAG
ncbi:MAG TPA: hypothetical protein VIL53_08085 [Solirubrobacterales bacterium]